ncbi:hypothetical protein BX666DRAFT_2017105 [Dichotomocladium elegans]|nr:hypothetical protein BX666DRAFT_2017105 [Dichotomocladium elegans]
MSWVAVVHLVIYNLIRRQNIIDRDKPEEERRHKYFRWKDDICTFIDEYWDYLVPGKKRSPTWHNTIASVLSTHGTIFKSGYEKFRQSAWWTLHDEESVPLKESKAKTSKPKPGQKRSARESRSEKPKRLKAEPQKAHSAVIPSPPPANQEDELFDLGSESDLSSDPGSLTDDEGTQEKKIQEVCYYDKVVTGGPSSFFLFQSPSMATPSASAKPGPSLIPNEFTDQNESDTRSSPVASESVAIKKEPDDSVPVSLSAEPPNTTRTLKTEDEEQMEWQMLERLRNASKKLPPVAARYERKLNVRRLKRSLGLKLFDIDSFVAKQLRSSTELTPVMPNITNKQTQSLMPEHQLRPNSAGVVNAKADIPHTDNFVSGVTDGHAPSSPECNITYTPYNNSFASRLYGPIRPERVVTKDEPWLSSWNGRKLRPYIRRDFESVTPRMMLMEQIKARHPDYQQRELHSIDYVYFQPQHLMQVNTMLRRCFWDGVDVSESLLFPEFSVVALYKRLVVGCAFMTPEAYVTYIAVLPGWDNAGIGQFMLYHLFQTAISKDITLHVSANNSAMILYQKFGFKPEEFIVDFYDKYLPSDSSYSKNAFFLRLRR